MVDYETKAPGVYIEEIAAAGPIAGASTSTAALIGTPVAAIANGAAGVPVAVTNWTQYTDQFGGYSTGSPLPYAMHGFFDNGGTFAYVVPVKDVKDAAGMAARPRRAHPGARGQPRVRARPGRPRRAERDPDPLRADGEPVRHPRRRQRRQPARRPAARCSPSAAGCSPRGAGEASTGRGSSWTILAPTPPSPTTTVPPSGPRRRDHGPGRRAGRRPQGPGERAGPGRASTALRAQRHRAGPAQPRGDQRHPRCSRGRRRCCGAPAP